MKGESIRCRPNEHKVEDRWGTFLQNTLTALCVCFLKGKIKPSDQVFHFLVLFLILECLPTTLGRWSGTSWVTATHIWGHLLQNKFQNKSVLPQNTFSELFLGSITLEVGPLGSYKCPQCKPTKEKTQASWIGLLWLAYPCVPICLGQSPFISVDLVRLLTVPSFQGV